jgi:hypothetical protein
MVFLGPVTCTLEYFKQQVHLVDGRRVRTLNS